MDKEEINIEHIHNNTLNLETSLRDFLEGNKKSFGNVLHCAYFLRNYIDDIFDNKELVTLGIKHYGSTYKFLKLKFKEDKEIAKLAILEDVEMTKEIPKHFLKEKQFIIDVVKENKDQSFYKYIPKDLFNDKDVIEEILESKTDISIYMDFNENIWNNEEFSLKICNRYPYRVSKLSEKLRNDKEIMIKYVKAYAKNYHYLSERLKLDEDIVDYIMKKYPRYLPEKLRNDKKYMIKIIKYKSSNYEFCSIKLKKDKELSLEAVSYMSNNYLYIDNSLKNDRDIAMAAVNSKYNQYPYYFLHFSDNLKHDLELCKIFINKHRQYTHYVPEEIMEKIKFSS